MSATDAVPAPISAHPETGLDRAARQLRSDYDQLVGDARSVAFEALKALGRAALAQAARRPVTTAVCAAAALSTVMTLLGRRTCDCRRVHD